MELSILLLVIFYTIGFPIAHATWEYFNADFMMIDPVILFFSYACWPVTFTLWAIYRVTIWLWERSHG